MLGLFLAHVASFDGECFLCKTAAQIALELIDAQVKEADIPEKIKQFCTKKMPFYLQSLCTELGTFPLDKLVELIENQQTPTEACTAIKLCKKVAVKKNRAPVSNGAPQFKDETSPQWSISWEEQI